jgi:hypothetical protein
MIYVAIADPSVGCAVVAGFLLPFVGRRRGSRVGLRGTIRFNHVIVGRGMSPAFMFPRTGAASCWGISTDVWWSVRFVCACQCWRRMVGSIVCSKLRSDVLARRRSSCGY